MLCRTLWRQGAGDGGGMSESSGQTKVQLSIVPYSKPPQEDPEFQMEKANPAGI